MDAEPASTPARLPQLPPYFSLNGSPPEVQVQIDGRGRAHWMWLPAAARALGAPTPISISGHGAADFLAWGDILSAANRRASEDPDGFARDFAQALLPWEAPAPGLSNMGMRYDAAPSSVIHHFVAADRCCVEEHAIDSQTLPGQDSRPSPRL